ncbi:MAG: Rieske (2Fe-2S) protein [Deltaproteobacteria bacterium]|nr:Rieske (2Fe-2S) protein [Deltaproteobacteria bacterium]
MFPLVVGRVASLPEPDSFFTHDATGIPFLVTRDPWGTPHAFVNLCRHRGARLVYEERGREARFACRHHGWTYDTCGRMTNVALSKCDAEQMRRESSLVSMKCAARHGFVWLGRGPFRDDWDLAADLGETDAVLGALGLDAAEVISEESGELPEDWKRVVERMLDEPSVLVFPSSIVRVAGDVLEHVAVFPKGVDAAAAGGTRGSSYVLTTRLGGADASALATVTRTSSEAFHDRIERALAAHPRRF